MEKIIYDNGVRALHVTLPQTRILFIFFVYIFIHNLANKSPFGLKFSQMILNTDTSNLMYNSSCARQKGVNEHASSPGGTKIR